MHKIPKYQFPNEGINRVNQSDPQFLINEIISKFQSTLKKVTETNQLKTLDSTVSQPNSGGGTAPPPNAKTKSFASFLQKNSEIAGLAPDVIETGLNFSGVKQADTTSGGEQLFSQASSGAFKMALQTGNPIAIGITGAIKGLDLVNRYAGSTAKKQGTDANLNTGGYQFQVSPNAGMKQTVLGSIGWGGKKTSKTANYNKLTQRADRNNLLAGAATFKDTKNQLAASNTYSDVVNKTFQQLGGGNKTNLLSAKKGTKINPKKLSNIKNAALRNIKKAQEGAPTDDLQKMSLGGGINVIPEGALHARKNNYEGELGEQVTSKGIPVISYKKDGKIVQHAEIENSEIIFNKELTLKLEEWEKEYRETSEEKRKKELELECGKCLTYEILENTDDNMDLINKVN